MCRLGAQGSAITTPYRWRHTEARVATASCRRNPTPHIHILESTWRRLCDAPFRLVFAMGAHILLVGGTPYVHRHSLVDRMGGPLMNCYGERSEALSNGGGSASWTYTQTPTNEHGTEHNIGHEPKPVSQRGACRDVMRNMGGRGAWSHRAQNAFQGVFRAACSMVKALWSSAIGKNVRTKMRSRIG